MRISNSRAVSLIQRVLMTLVLRLIVNDGFSFDSSIACPEFFRVSWVNTGDRRQKFNKGRVGNNGPFCRVVV